MPSEEEIRLETREEWSTWLEENHASSNGVWMLFYKKHTGRPRVPYDDAVIEAIRYGWIDGKVMTVDEDSYKQRFSPRRKRSNWSAINRERAERIIEEGSMTPSGSEKIDEARQNGMWERALWDRRMPPMPAELAEALGSDPDVARSFDSLAEGYRREFVRYVAEAKRSETRVRRSGRVVDMVRNGERPGMWKPSSQE